MPKARRLSPRHRRAAAASHTQQPHDPVGILAFAVAALRGALAAAAPKEASAIARQLVATAKEWEAALARADSRARDAAEARKEQEIEAMIRVLRQEIPQYGWTPDSVRCAAETLHEEGMKDIILGLPDWPEDVGGDAPVAAPSPPARTVAPVSAMVTVRGPDFDWDAFCAEWGLEPVDAGEEDEEEEEGDGDPDEAAAPAPCGPRVSSL